MKTKLTILTAILFLSLGVFAQTPEKINYQAVARDLDGNALTGETVNIQFDIIQASTVVYSETQTLTTNQFGLFTAAIGAGTVVSGNFSTIDWGGNTSALQVTVNGDVMPSTQLLSVPYALYSKESLNGPTGAQGPAGLGINWLGTLTTVPGSANLNDAYYNSAAGKSYIYDGAAWTIMAQDGNASGDDWGTQVVQTNGGNILGDGTTSNPIIVIDNDTSKTNELQTLNFNTSNKNIIEISNGNGISLSPTTPNVNQVLTWNGTNWEAQTASSGTDWLTGTGSDIYNNTDSVGIGTTNPKSLLQLGSYYHIFPLNMAANEDYSISTYNAYWDGATLRNTNTGASVVSISGDNNGTPQYSVLLYPSQPAGTNITPIDPFPKFNLKGKGLAINKDNPDAALHVSSTDSASIMMSDPDDGSQATLIYEVGSTEYVSLRAPAILSTGSYTLTYPSELPSVSGANLVSDLSGNLSWGAPATAAWSLGGNTGTALGTHFIGTIDAQGLDFRTNNISRMLISSTGNVGIGTTNPLFKFHVNTSSLDRAGYFINSTSTTANKFGIYAIASGNGTGENIGGWFDASGSGTGIHYGVAGQSLGSSENRAVYGNALNGATNWAGYFESGDVYIQNKVAIGTSSPDGKLHMAETKAIYDGSDGAFMYIQNTDATSNTGQLSGIKFRTDGVGAGANARYKGGIAFQKTGSFGVGDLLFLTNSTNSSASVTAADEKMRITSSGYVGIGTSSPSHTLEIENANPNLRLKSPTLNAVNSGSIIFSESTTDGFTLTYDGSSNLFKINTFSVPNALTIARATGNVGIGTSSPTEKLHVIGNVKATSFIATLTGAGAYKYNSTINMAVPDYVFDKYYFGVSKENPIYKNLTINETEDFIKKNHHLPRVPSREEILEDGAMNIQGLQMLTLEKIEELFLHTIEQQKMIEELQKEIELLKNKQ